MSQKKMYKVLALIPGKDGKRSWWMQLGSAFENKDGSINCYLDAIPVAPSDKGITLQIRELDDNDRQRIEAARARRTGGAIGGSIEPPWASRDERPAATTTPL